MEETINKIHQRLDSSLQREDYVLKSLESLIESIKQLGASHAELVKMNVHLMDSQTKLAAMMKSMTSILAEVCSEYGVDAPAFLEHLNLRAQVFHHRQLTKLESTDPAFAASFDTRDLADVPDSDLYPPILRDVEGGPDR